MPIPGSVLGNLLPFGSTCASAVYPSLATLRPITKATDTTGQETHTFADSTTAGQHDLPCRLSPLIQLRPQLQEPARGIGILTDQRFQLNFESYINLTVSTLVQWQVKVDGVIYQILSVESDGSKIVTRMEVAIISPYNP